MVVSWSSWVLRAARLSSVHSTIACSVGGVELLHISTFQSNACGEEHETEGWGKGVPSAKDGVQDC
jgi:hypothetical protein